MGSQESQPQKPVEAGAPPLIAKETEEIEAVTTNKSKRPLCTKCRKHYSPKHNASKEEQQQQQQEEEGGEGKGGKGEHKTCEVKGCSNQVSQGCCAERLCGQHGSQLGLCIRCGERSRRSNVMSGSPLAVGAQPDFAAIKKLLVDARCEEVELVGKGSVVTASIGKNWKLAFFSATVLYRPHPSVAGALQADLIIDSDYHIAPLFLATERPEQSFRINIDLHNLRRLTVHHIIYTDDCPPPIPDDY